MHSTKLDGTLGDFTAGEAGEVFDQQHCLAAISTHEDDRGYVTSSWV